ncbi:MAG: hypothetical protein GYA24_22420 [Candidatus Lokiarchaeota archaeon]|nr:hypothetical protein [Candidatus Lokiarchaeota archaeon]
MKRPMACAGLLAVLCIIMATQAASATATQWYPQAGTAIEYQLNWNLSFKNGTRYTETLFNVYNQTSEHAIYILAKAMEDNIYMVNGLSNYVRLAAGVPVTLKHAHVETSATTLERHASITASSYMFDAGKIRVLLFRNATLTIISAVNTTSDSLVKSSFITAPNGFVDHVDCTKNPGDIFMDAFQASMSTSVFRLPATITGKSPDRITASWVYNQTTFIYRGAYTMDPAGQVLDYTYALSGGTLYASIAGASITYYRATAASFLPEWAYWIICAGLLVLVIGMAALALKRGKRT